MPIVVKEAYALNLQGGLGSTIVPDRVEADQERPCSATAMRKATRRLTQLYANALAAVGLRTTLYAILEKLQRQADAAPIAALQFVEVAARSARLPA